MLGWGLSGRSIMMALTGAIRREREILAFVTCKRDTGVAHKPQALTVVGGVDLDRTNYS